MINLWLLIAFAVLAIGLGLLLRGWRGRIDWTGPTCAACKYSLRQLDPTINSACPECGTDLRATRAVRFGRYGRNKKLIIAGFGVSFIPILMLAGYIGQQAFNIRLSQFRSDQSVIARLAKNSNDYSAWQELIARRFDRTIDNREISQIVDHLIAALQARLFEIVPGDPAFHFLEVVVAEGAVSDDQFARLCAAYYANRLKVNMPPSVRRGGLVTFNVAGIHWNIPGAAHIYALREVRLGDKAIPLAPPHTGHSRLRHLSGVAPWGIDGELTIDVEPGNHELHFIFDHGAISDLSNPFNALAPPGPAEQWPSTIFKDTLTVAVTCAVVGPEESPIALVAPPEHRQAITSALRVTALRLSTENARVQPQLIFNPTGDVPIPCSFTVHVRSNENEQEIGSCTIGHGSVGKSGLVRIDEAQIDSDTVDVIFRTDLKGIEGRTNWTQIWGEEIIINNVPVVRAASLKEMRRHALRAALQVNAVRLGGRQGQRIHGPGLDMSRQDLTIDVRFKIFIRAGEFEYELGSMHGGPNQVQTVIPMVPVEGFPEDAQTADVIFRPFLDGLSIQQKREHWDEEIVIEDVPVVRPE